MNSPLETTPQHHDEGHERNGVARNIFAILGFIAILLAGLWATVELVKRAAHLTSNMNMPALTQSWKQKKEAPGDDNEQSALTITPTTTSIYLETAEHEDRVEPAAQPSAPVETSAAVTPQPKPVTVVKQVPVRNTDPNGLPDLSVRMIESGLTAAHTYSVKFEVINNGTKLAQNWAFTALLPTHPAYTYTSEPQAALYAGERMELLLTFDKVQPGNLLITVDSFNTLTEQDELNNILVYPIAL